MMIIWDDSMTTGVPEIDAQHREIVDRFNALAAALGGKGREETARILDFLQYYAQWHFEQEEQCMEQYHCPAAVVNKSQHAEFINRFGHLYQQAQQSEVNLQLVLSTFIELQDWIVNHIRRVDTLLYPCVKRRLQNQ